jgi:hypothetical protein
MAGQPLIEGGGIRAATSDRGGEGRKPGLALAFSLIGAIGDHPQLRLCTHTVKMLACAAARAVSHVGKFVYTPRARPAPATRFSTRTRPRSSDICGPLQALDSSSTNRAIWAALPRGFLFWEAPIEKSKSLPMASRDNSIGATPFWAFPWAPSPPLRGYCDLASLRWGFFMHHCRRLRRIISA